MWKSTQIFSVALIFLSFISVSAQDDSLITSEMPGRIAFIGSDQNVYLFTPADGETRSLTEDAAFTSSEDFRYYAWPTWSTDGRLAYFSVVNTETMPPTTEAYVSANGTRRGRLIYTGERELFNYASWAPVNCSDAEGCRALSMLLSGGGGLFVGIVKDGVEGNPSEVIGRGGPFYYSWSPDGSQMLWQRNNRRMDIYNLEAGDIDLELDQSPGVFQAPDWSPTDDRWLFGEYDADAGKTDLIIVTDEAESTLVEGLEGIVYFAWAPDGKSVAYVNANDTLTVVDVSTGDVTARTYEGGVASFFWSPDSTHIAYITLATPPDSATAKGGMLMAPAEQQAQIAWSVLDVLTGDVNRYGAFIPTRDMLYLFNYFDQFAQSHSIWSPDSRYIVYSEIIEEEAYVNVLDVSLSDTVPLSIGSGTLGIWSYDD